jgi:hypothetical protein
MRRSANKTHSRRKLRVLKMLHGFIIIPRGMDALIIASEDAATRNE